MYMKVLFKNLSQVKKNLLSSCRPRPLFKNLSQLKNYIQFICRLYLLTSKLGLHKLERIHFHFFVPKKLLSGSYRPKVFVGPN